MKKIDKTKDELLRELDVLKQNNAALKAMYEKDITEHKRTEEALKESEEKYRELVESSPDAIVIYSEGKVVFANRSSVSLMRASNVDELIGKPIIEFIHPASKEFVTKRMAGINQSKEVLQLAEEKFLRFDGSEVDVEVKAIPVVYNKKPAVQVIVRDITERKRVEEELHMLSLKQNAILASVPDIIMEVDNNKVYTWANNAGKEFFGNDVIGNRADFYFEGEQKTYNTVKPLFDGEENIIYVESWQRRKDGEKRLLAWWCKVLKDKNGNVSGALSSAQDITERKKSEEDVRESEERFRMVFENVFDGISIYSEDPDPSKRRLIECNERYAAMAGRSRDEMLKLENTLGLQITREDNANDNRLKSLDQETSYQGSFSWIRPDGKENVIEYVGMPIIWRGKSYSIGIDRDITERNHAEEALRESEKKFRTVIEEAAEIIFTTNTDGYFTYANPIALKSSGYSLDELRQLKYIDLVELEYRQRVNRNYFKQYLKRNELSNTEYPFRTKSGEIKWFNQNARLIIENNEVKGFYVIARDVTERRKVEEALRKSEERFRSLYENSTMGLYRTTPDGKIILANSALVKILGYSSFDELAKRDLQKDGFEPNYKRESFIEQIEKNGFIKGLESAWTRRDGTVVYVRESAITILDADGKTLFYDGTVENITERRNAEESLKESEKKYRELINGMTDTVWVVDLEGDLIDVNDSAVEILGYSKKELLTIGIYGIDLSLSKEDITALVKAMPTSKVQTIETKHTTKDGRTFPVEINSTLVTYMGNRAILSIARDISERKLAEETIRNERQLFRTLIDNIPDSIYSKDALGRKTVANLAEVHNLGAKSEAEVLGKDDFAFYPKELAEGFYADDRLVLQKGIPVLNREEFIFDNNGKKRWLLTSKLPLKDMNNKIIGLAGIGRDITERKQAEEARDQERILLRTLIDNFPNSVFVKDKKYRKIIVNPEHVRRVMSRLGLANSLSEKDLLGKTDFEVYPRELAERYFVEDQKVLEGGQSILDQELLSVDANGRTHCELMSKIPLRDRNGEIIGFVGISNDITERNQAEKLTEALYGISHAIFSTENIEEFYHHIHSELSSIIPARNFFIALLTNDEKKLYFPYNHDENEANESFTIDADDTHSLTVEVLRSKRPLLLNENELHDRYSSGKNKVWGTAPKCWLGVPLMIREKAIGVVAVQDYDRDNVYSQKDVSLFESAAGQIAIAIERKRSEEEITMLAHSLRSINECVSITDLEDKIIFVNESFLNTYGFFEDELLGKHISIVRSLNNPAEFVNEIFPTTILGGWSGELWNKRKDGSEFMVHLSTTIINDKDNKPLGLIGVATDITERKRTEEELVNAKVRAEQSDKLKSEFLAQMSHEIRTPLNAIVGNVDYLNDLFDEGMDDDTLDCFNGISLTSKRIIRTIDLIINVAELQTSGYIPHFEKIDLNLAIINKLYKEHQPSALQKGLEFIYSCKEKDANVTADAYSVTQIFTNLIDNAIKYTKKGKVEIIIGRNKSGVIIVEVKDTGIGISKEFLPRLFEPFVQEQQGYSRSYEGNGLGLALVKKYCEVNNTTIEVESEKNIGTTFRIIFDKKTTEASN